MLNEIRFDTEFFIAAAGTLRTSFRIDIEVSRCAARPRRAGVPQCERRAPQVLVRSADNRLIGRGPESLYRRRTPPFAHFRERSFGRVAAKHLTNCVAVVRPARNCTTQQKIGAPCSGRLADEIVERGASFGAKKPLTSARTATGLRVPSAGRGSSQKHQQRRVVFPGTRPGPRLSARPSITGRRGSWSGRAVVSAAIVVGTRPDLI